MKNFLSTKIGQKIIFYLMVICIGYVTVAYSADFSASEEELTKFNEKYLKGKLTPTQDPKIAEMIKTSDIAKQRKDLNITMQEIEANATIKTSYDANSSASKSASDINNLVREKSFNKTLNDHKKFILDNYEIEGKKMEVSPETHAKLMQDLNQTVNGAEMLFIVISSSMPDSDIREYFKAVEGKSNIRFVLRGMIGGVQKFEPTRKYIEKLVKKNPNDKDSQEVYNVAVEINPKITKRYEIDKVPAIVYVKNYDGQADKAEAVKKNENEQFWVSYGTATFEYVIEQINKEAKSDWLASLLKKSTFFNQ